MVNLLKLKVFLIWFNVDLFIVDTVFISVWFIDLAIVRFYLVMLVTAFITLICYAGSVDNIVKDLEARNGNT